jgi:protein-tyrosine phosphatase
MMSYARRFAEQEVPDPYYGGPQGFERVLDMLEDAAQGLLESLRKGREVPGFKPSE